MTDEEKEILERTYELAKDTNDKVSRLYRSHRWGRAIKIIYWVAIIGMSLGAYWLIQPYVDQLKEVYSGVGDTVDTIRTTSQNLLGF
ncbi:MAG: hypothetical protein WC673_01780 [Candidatus Paceibacterota bacterium]|jgi:hypothetical protein